VVVLAVLALCCLASAVCASKLTTLQVEPKAEDCVYVEMDRNQQAVLTFAVVRGGLLDIRLVIKGPGENGNVIYDSMVFFNGDKEDFDGSRAFTAVSAGPHSICFDNKMARYTAKVISFSVDVVGRSQTVDVDEPLAPAKGKDLNPLDWAISRINSALKTVEREQQTFRVREQSHRDLTERMATRILKYSIAEAAVLSGMGGLQIFLLRRWFTQKAERMG